MLVSVLACGGRVSAQQPSRPQLGTSETTPSIPSIPGPTATGTGVQPSSLTSRPAATEQPKLTTGGVTPPNLAEAPQVKSMKELRASLRDEGLKNLGFHEFTSQVGARPPVPPPSMTKTNTSWFSFSRDHSNDELPSAKMKAPDAPATATPSSADGPWTRFFARVGIIRDAAPSQPDAAPSQAQAPAAQPTNTASNPSNPNDGPWHRAFVRVGLVRDAAPSQPEAAPMPPPQPMPQPTNSVSNSSDSLWRRTLTRIGIVRDDPPVRNDVPQNATVLPEIVPARAR
jgi:hypothetical protein